MSILDNISKRVFFKTKQKKHVSMQPAYFLLDKGHQNNTLLLTQFVKSDIHIF